MGIGRCVDVFSQRIEPDSVLHWPIPPSWDVESAVPLPFAYATVSEMTADSVDNKQTCLTLAPFFVGLHRFA